MTRFAIALFASALLAGFPLAAGAAASDDTYVRLTTDAGEILLELRLDLAPRHVANFVHLCRSGFYDGTAFHRVIPGFMIQGGDPNSKDDDRSDDGQGGPEWADVLAPDELAQVAKVRDMLAAKGYAGLEDRPRLMAEFNGGRHIRGTLSMARAQAFDTAGSQFFICVADAPNLDGKYTVFGRVALGMDTVDEIVSAERDRRDNPLLPVRIKKAEVLTGRGDLTDAERAAVSAGVAPAAAD